jgi:XTP/dITP diphosphohydrolase
MSEGASRREVVVATSNAGKVREIRAILGELPLTIVGLDAVPEIRFPEEGDDYEVNARVKAEVVASRSGRPAVADDSGLEVEGLGGVPGPRSARYGGPGLDDAGRATHLLEQMRDLRGDARRARFVCVAALATPEGGVVTTRGECAGRILDEPVGSGGFGYDPVFEPEGETRAMAQLSPDEKNRISHRARAFRALRDALLRLA